ncbi:DUF3833 domain-containing protein [Thalassobaculum sp. OXR-137]|uniref:DUF3833 domain-containing protein n=1 Tax=Thalassobaculum sp. OXR-137 TaxID=3100173 RepID=UPI0039FD9B67
MLYRFAYVVTVLLLLGGCQSMQIDDFKGTTPKLVLEDYFEGKTKAWGIFEDRFGNLRRQFVVDITGTWDGTTLTLDEQFDYADGEKDQRIWRIEKVGENSYVGRASDVIGTAQGQTEGSAFSWTYEMELNIQGHDVKVRFDDWMFLQSDGVMVNRAYVTKFGIELGTVTLFFQKASAERAETGEGREAA